MLIRRSGKMMDMHIKNRLGFLVCLLLLVGNAQYAKRPLGIPAARPNLYPVNVNAQKEIKEALAAAAPGNKRVILVFGRELVRRLLRPGLRFPPAQDCAAVERQLQGRPY